jgi:hypothetical protein
VPAPTGAATPPVPPGLNGTASPPTQRGTHGPPRPSRFSTHQARTLTLAGFGVAALSELYFQLGAATPTTKTLSMIGLVVAAVLFGLGAVQRWLPADLDPPVLGRVSPLRVFRPGTGAIAGGVGALAFATLLGRLWTGSVSWSDLLLWAVALIMPALAMPNERRIRRPARPLLTEIGGVSVLILLFVLLNVRDVNSWYYAAIGDEYAFLNEARGTLTDGIRRPFAQDGVYGAHPMLGVIFQAAVMAVFGRDHAGWLLSSILSAALAIPAMYLIGRTLGGRAVGLIGAALFASSHYLFAFSHLGYNNVMAPTPTAWAVALFLLGVRRQSTPLMYGAGIAAGLGFYTFYSARATMPILGLVVLAQYGWRGCLTPRGLRDRLLEQWPLILGFVLAAAPIFAANGTAVITRMLNEVPGGYNAQITGPPGQKFVTNFWLNVPAYFGGLQGSHFATGSLLDPVTAALAALGIGLAVRWWSHIGAKVLLIWAAVGIGITALLSPYPYVAITRLLFGVPPLVLLAALAAVQVWKRVPRHAASPQPARIGYAAVVGLLVLVLSLNLQRFWVTTPNRMHMTQDAVVVKALRSDLCGPDMTRTVVVMRGFGLLRASLLSYGPDNTLPRMVTHEELRPEQPIAVDGVRCVIFGDPNDDISKLQVEALTRAHPGAEVVPFRDLSGIAGVVIFRPPGTAR